MIKKNVVSKCIFTMFLLFILCLSGTVSAFASDIINGRVVDSKKVWTIRFTDEVLFDDLTKQGIRVIDSKNTPVPVKLELGEDKNKVLVNPPSEEYKKGEEYTLEVDENARSINHVNVTKLVEMKFTIKDEQNQSSGDDDAKIKELNDGKEHNGNYTISKLGTLGPINLNGDSEYRVATTINGDVDIKYPNAKQGDKIVLQNLDINGTLTADFGEGDIELDNVKVNGVIVTNVGSNSIHIKGNSTIGLLTIQDTNNNAHIVVEENAGINNTILYSGAKLEVANGAKNNNPFANVIINLKSEDEVTLSGIFDNINIKKAKKINIDKNTQIKSEIKVGSSAELNVENGAKVGKINIDTKQADDKVILNGDLNNVNVNSAANIEIKSGNVQIGTTTDSNVKLSVDENANVTTRKGSDNIKVSGKGTVTRKDTLSDKATVESLNFDNSNVERDKLWDIPAAIKVSDLLKNVKVSDFAIVDVIDERENIVGGDKYLTESMKLRVISESQKVKNKFEIEFEWTNGSSYEIEGIEYDESAWENEFDLDTNSKKGELTATIKFNGAENETDIDGYYLSVVGGKIVKNGKSNKEMEEKSICQVFVSKSSLAGDKYTVDFKNVDLEGYKIINLSLKAIVNNKVAYDLWQEIYDNPVKTTLPSKEGIVIGEFIDTNKEKGKIEGTITFTKAKDESNIKYYEVVICKGYNNNGGDDWEEIGYVEPSDAVNGVYTISTEQPIRAGVTQDINILVIPTNEDGLQDYDNRVKKIIIDNPKDKQLELTVPKLVSDENEDYRLNITNAIEGSVLKLYKYNSAKERFVPYVKNGKVVTINLSREKAEIDKVDSGRYKVTQTADGKETDMSNEAVIKPMRLAGVLQNTTLSILNAIDNATIKVYDKDSKLLKTLIKKNGKVPVIDDLKPGLYYVTQTVDGIESENFVVPV